MKKLFLMALAATLGTAAASAQFGASLGTPMGAQSENTLADFQFAKGAFWVKGKTTGLNLSMVSYDGNSSTTIELGAEIAYFVMDRLAITAEVDIKSLPSSDGESTTTFIPGAGARYYLSTQGWFLGAGLKFGEMTNIRAEAGYSWFIRDNIFIEPAVQFAKDYYKGEISEVTQINLIAGIGIKF